MTELPVLDTRWDDACHRDTARAEMRRAILGLNQSIRSN